MWRSKSANTRQIVNADLQLGASTHLVLSRDSRESKSWEQTRREVVLAGCAEPE